MANRISRVFCVRQALAEVISRPHFVDSRQIVKQQLVLIGFCSFQPFFVLPVLAAPADDQAGNTVGIGSEIFNGVDAEANAWPFMVHLYTSVMVVNIFVALHLFGRNGSLQPLIVLTCKRLNLYILPGLGRWVGGGGVSNIFI